MMEENTKMLYLEPVARVLSFPVEGTVCVGSINDSIELEPIEWGI